MHTYAHCSIIHNSQNMNIIEVSINGWMGRGDVGHIHNEYYSALKNEILPFVITWMDLEDIMLSEIRQRQILCDFTYMWNIKNKTDIEIKQNRIHRCREWNCGC